MQKDFYTTAHLIVAVVRILEHRNSSPPSVEEICKTLSFSLEQGNFICKKLDEIGIIEMLKGGYGTRIFINDHLKIEDIPRDSKGTSLQEEIEKFQNSRKDFKQQIESFQAEKAERQKNLFAEIESRLKAKGVKG